MICHVSDPQTTQRPPSVAPAPSALRSRWWSRPSPWFWGVVCLLVVAGIVVTQIPRLGTVLSPEPKPSPTAPTNVPRLSGPVYTQAMVAGRNFIGADLRGAVLVHLDLRGRDFGHADAAGAV